MKNSQKRSLILFILAFILVAVGGVYYYLHATKPPLPNGAEPVIPLPNPEPDPIIPDPDPIPDPAPDPGPDEETFLLDLWPLILINKDNPISLDFKPSSLDSVDGYYELDGNIVPLMQEMIAVAQSQGIYLRLVSAYRDSALQSYLYDQEVAQFEAWGYEGEEAKAEAAKWVALPGTSEHQTGLAADIVSYEWLAAGNGLTVEFAEDDAAIWLKDNAADFGFILRYPEDKTEITGIAFEPWHYRYVGKEAAGVIAENQWSLEEFFDYYK